LQQRPAARKDGQHKPNMSDRTKFFADQEAQAVRERQRQADEDAENQRRRDTVGELFTRVASLYEESLTRLRDELKEKGLEAEVSSESAAIRAVDPSTREEVKGTSSRTLTFKAGAKTYEIALVQVHTPSPLSMLCWRTDKKQTHVKVQNSALPPDAIVKQPDLAENCVNNALAAAQRG
jgi:hypothetical protein